MKKNLFYGLLTATVLLFASSCKKDDPVVTPPAPDTSPIIKAYYINYGTTVSASGSGGYEYGCKFSVTKAGKITKLACKMPAAGSYRVTLWDASGTGTQLAQATIGQAANGALTFASITPVTLSTSGTYLVSIYSSGGQQWFQIVPIGGGNFAYPITAGNIQVKGYSWIGSATATPIKFPTNNDNTYAAGLADFEFQAD